MMRSRKDYAKDFELVVKQEIKNYNDTVLSTNISLNNCNQKIDQLVKDIERKFAEQESKQLEKESKLKIQKESIDRCISQLIIMLGDLEAKLISHQNSSLVFQNKVEESFLRKEEVFRLFSQNDKDLEELNLNNHRIKEELSHQIKIISRDFKEEFEKLKDEILNKPSEAKAVKADLEKKIESVSIDSEGVLKELRIVKKDSMIIEKNIEHIYTLIERINKRIS